MARIARADAKTIARDAVVLDLGKLQARGDALVESARRKSEEIIKNAHAERERLIEDASRVGHEQGFAQGLEQGKQQGLNDGRAEALAQVQQDLEALTEAWQSALEEFETRRAELLMSAKEDVLRLACDIASLATGQVLESRPELVQDLLEEILGLVVHSTRLRVRICPEDRALFERALPDLASRFTASRNLELVDDESLSRGSCIAMTDRHGSVDASVQTRLERITRAILPESEPEA